MSWRHKEDLGTSIVAFIHESLKVQDRFNLDHGRGFTWWASDYAQTVYSDVGLFHNMSTLYRIHTEIELLSGNGKADDVEVALMQGMEHATLSALTYDPEKDLFKLHCSVYADYDNEEWLRRVVMGAVGLQVSQAHRTADAIAHALGLRSAKSGHPVAGMRTQPDPMVQAEDRFFKPFGAVPSKWTGSAEWDQARENLKRICQRCVTDNQGCLEADFDWWHASDDACVKLFITTDEPHPELGNGVSFRLLVPVNLIPEMRAHLALHLNEMERKEWNWCHDIGSWTIIGNDLAFVCFVPNITYAPNVLAELAHDMGIRAKWANEQFANAMHAVAVG
jgi:hypothetical protein